MAVDNKPPAPSSDLRVWADELYKWLTSSKGQSRLEPATVLLAHRKTDRAERAAVAGMLMYDQLLKSPIVSRGGAWYSLSSWVYDVSAQTDTSYTFTNADAGRLVTVNNASPVAITLPAEAVLPLERGTVLKVLQLDAGTATITGNTGVTVNGVSGGSLSASGIRSVLVALKIGPDDWVVNEGGL